MKKGGGKAKGASFERIIAKRLSLWWTEGTRDDIFARSITSGAWSKTRSKKGLSTSTQQGDIQAIDQQGKAFTDTCCIEVKRGYKGWSFLDVIDSQDPSSKQTIQKFWEQVLEDVQGTAKIFPIVIAKRDRRAIVIFTSTMLYKTIKNQYGIPKFPVLILSNPKIVCCQFDNFLEWCPPDFFANYD